MTERLKIPTIGPIFDCSQQVYQKLSKHLKELDTFKYLTLFKNDGATMYYDILKSNETQD